jgi:hypothetical protein
MKSLEEYVSEFVFSDPSKGGLNCKNSKFLDGRQVVYHVKGLNELLANFIFLGTRVTKYNN